MTNWQNRTLFHGDNLGFLRAMNSESVDLIATDPPFNKGRDFHATPDSLAAGAKFQDRWSWERDVHPDWVDQITDDHPKLMEAIEGARYAHSDGMGAFMCFMAVRLLEMRRVLKPTGSIYLHCDPTASHYLKAVMDAIFGWQNFQNEIVWCYAKWTNISNQFQKNHDTLLFYTVGKKHTFNQQFILTSDKAAKLKIGYQVNKPGGVKQLIVYDRKKAKRVIEEGDYEKLIYKTEDNEGTALNSVWNDINILNSQARERVGYPTQKPLALYERIIKASSNEGDIVLDPFCGCATTLVAAERLKRQWVGMDIWDNAKTVVMERLAREGLNGEGKAKTGLFDEYVYFITQPPERTDDGETASSFLPVKEQRRRPLEPWQQLSRAEIFKELSEAQSLDQSLGDSKVLCAGCGRALEPPFMELDHITPRADRGANDISNRILLCRPCNGRKSARLTMKGLIQENKRAGWMMDESLAYKARDLATKRYEDVRHNRPWPPSTFELEFGD